VVQNLYQEFFHRAADTDGLNNSVNFLNAGGTLSQLRAILASSPEYFQQRGSGTDSGFVNAFLTDAVGTVDGTASANDTKALDNGLSRGLLAEMVFKSKAAQQNEIQDLYQTAFHRGADGGSLSNLTNLFQQGYSETTLLIQLLASTEYFNRS
jgi:hypothetical protein